MKALIKNHRAFCCISALTLCAALLHILFVFSAAAADSYNQTAGSFFRLLLSKLTGILPFSAAEILLFLALPAAVAGAIIINKKGGSVRSRIKACFICFLSVCGVIYTFFVLTFACGYQSPALGEKLGFDDEPVYARDLYDTMLTVIDGVNAEAEAVSYSDDGSSAMPFSLDYMNRTLSSAYKAFYGEYGLHGAFNSGVKPLIISPVMTYTHISGVYAFFTGEANINTNYPDYVCVYSAAHEMAHQRGIAREDEANFAAYSACISSEDSYIRYSGYLSMYELLADALSGADAKLYADAASRLSAKAKGELAAYSRFFKKYSNSTASVISNAVNDAYLKSQGTGGVSDYGYAVKLAVSYHKSKLKIDG